LIPRWLEELGCKVLAINDDPAAPFPHHPEPRPETMAQLSAVVKAAGADIGFAHDADGERLGIVTELGEPLSEEVTLVLAAQTRVSQRKGTIVTNVSTTGAIDRVAAENGGNVVRTPVGQTFISEALLAYDGILGGEGSGGVAVPEVQSTHDSAAAIGLVLERLAHTGERVSQAVEQLPKLVMLKHNVPVAPNRLYSVLQNFRAEVEAAELDCDLTDGIRVVMPEGWMHVRASNTESLIRIIVEAETVSEARKLLDWSRDRLKK
jgi:phosphomannomutase